MLQMYGFDGGTPLHRAREAITAAEPAVFATGGDTVDLTVLPRWTEYGPRHHCANRDAWYDLVWTAPADRILLDSRVYAHSSPAERQRLARVLAGAGVLPDVFGADEDEPVDGGLPPRGLLAGVLLRRALAHAGVLPPPDVIPFEERLEAAGAVTLEGLSKAQMALLGGPEAALQMLQRRQRIAVKSDRTVDIYDWDAWGRSAAGTIRALPVPAVV